MFGKWRGELVGDRGDSLAWLGQLQAEAVQAPEEGQRKSPDP